ncbi:hypothetical protein AB0E82_21070 [Streptomyces anulatus]|uniref:hypothetical protein n=1 Tax=Streptomyces anulatus TaxID=1892 RepID=UPI0033DFAB07
MTTYPDDHPSVRDAGRAAARRVLRTVFAGHELGPLAAQISDDIVDCVLPMIAANRITPRAEGYGEPVHWSVYNAMHLRALRAENALCECVDEHGPYCPQRKVGKEALWICHHCHEPITGRWFGPVVPPRRPDLEHRFHQERPECRKAGGWDEEPKPEHPMDRAYRIGAARIPDDMVAELAEATNTGRPTNWPQYSDRDGDVWELTDETYLGHRVMSPCAGDMHPMVRPDVEKHFGPLTAKGTDR